MKDSINLNKSANNPTWDCWPYYNQLFTDLSTPSFQHVFPNYQSEFFWYIAICLAFEIAFNFKLFFYDHRANKVTVFINVILKPTNMCA